MTVWYCCPSKRPLSECGPVFAAWRARGYRLAIFRDEADPMPTCDLAIQGKYEGYAAAVNLLVRKVLLEDDAAQWIVIGGDDIWPSTAPSDWIGAQCSEHFRRLHWPKCWRWAAGYRTPEEALAAGGYAEQRPQGLWSAENSRIYSTFGVMQPTGDRDFGDKDGPYIDRVAGSPWLGRSFCERINRGNGPLWPEYFHMGEDEELQAVATKLGIFWQRPDLTQRHEHWGRPKPGERMGHSENMPKFLERANRSVERVKYKALFAARQAAGFPGSEPL